MAEEIRVPQDEFETHLSALRDLFQEQLDKVVPVNRPQGGVLMYIPTGKEVPWMQFRAKHRRMCQNPGSWDFTTDGGIRIKAYCLYCGEEIDLSFDE